MSAYAERTPTHRMRLLHVGSAVSARHAEQAEGLEAGILPLMGVAIHDSSVDSAHAPDRKRRSCRISIAAHPEGLASEKLSQQRKGKILARSGIPAAMESLPGYRRRLENAHVARAVVRRP